MESKKLLSLVILVAVLIIGSFFLGSAAAQQEFVEMGIFVIVSILLWIIVTLGKNTWIVIPIFLGWSGKVSILPLPFSVSNLAIMFALGMWFLHLGTRKETFNWTFKKFDILIFAVLAFLILAFFRNPVGIRALGGTDLIGGRPYVEVLIALGAYIMLCGTTPDRVWFDRIPVLTIIAGVILAIGGAVAFFIPQVGIYLYQFYTGFVPDMTEFIGDTSSSGESQSVGRSTFLGILSSALVYYLYATKPPISNALPTNPLRMLLLTVSLVATLLSGFRGSLANQGGVFIIATVAWSGMKGVILTIVIATVVVVTIFFASVTVELPYQVQRVASFLPGDWDQKVVRSSKESTEWRVEMWREALYGDGIRNKWLGDGFGIKASEIAYHNKQKMMGTMSKDDDQRFHVLNGSLHSGPLTAVRYVGGVGLFFYLLLAVSVAVGYAKLWKMCINLNEMLIVGFFAIPAIYHPFAYTFLFGAFERDFPRLLISAGLLVMCTNLANARIRERRQEELKRSLASS